MSRHVTELLREASQLPEADRAELAGRLLETLSGEPEEPLRLRRLSVESDRSTLARWRRSRGKRFAQSSTLACMSVVSLHSAAEEELLKATEWYIARSATAAAGFVREIERALTRIAEAPER
jgi:hypothetical protein